MSVPRAGEDEQKAVFRESYYSGMVEEPQRQTDREITKKIQQLDRLKHVQEFRFDSLTVRRLRPFFISSLRVFPYQEVFQAF